MCSEEIQCCFLQNGILFSLCKCILTTTKVRPGGGAVVGIGVVTLLYLG